MSLRNTVLPTMIDVESAQQRIAPYVPATPILYSPLFKRQYGVDVYLKGDGFTPTGAFKLRGAVNALCCLTDEQKNNGVVAFSTGNHAQAVAYAASLLNTPAVIIMPNTAPEVKISNTRAFGAEVVLFDPDHEDREIIAKRYIDDQSMSLIHPYDDFNVIAGQGVSGLECCRQLNDMDLSPDRFYLAISGGGYLAGFGLATQSYFPSAELIGVEPEASPPWKISLKKNQIVQVYPQGNSICDAIMPPKPMPGNLPWELAKNFISHIETINDYDALVGMACAMKYFGVVAEPSGACSLGVIVKNSQELTGKTIITAMSGRNVDEDVLGKAMMLISKV